MKLNNSLYYIFSKIQFILGHYKDVIYIKGNIKCHIKKKNKKEIKQISMIFQNINTEKKHQAR